MNRISLIIPLLMLSQMLMANIHRVGIGGTCPGIKAAIAAAAPGDTVWVNGGFYKEQNIIISRPLVLLGTHRPVLDGEGKYEIISIRSDHVVIDGFMLQHSGNGSMEDLAGIKIYNARYITIANNRLDDTFFGIYSLYSAQCRLLNNSLSAGGSTEQASGNGIHCWKSDSLLIEGNCITGHRDGVYFEFVTNSTIRNNESYGNIRYGLHFMFSHNDRYEGNLFKQNGSGVAVMYSHGVVMLNNRFVNNWGDAAYGILLKDISDSQIEDNQFLGNTSGIYMEGSSRINIRHNQFDRNGWALKIQASCDGNTVAENNFTGNSFDVGTNGSLVLNRFTGNYWDKYEGYDLNRDGLGDVPYRPVSLFAMIVERNPGAMMLFHSFMAGLLDKAEKVIPGLTPESLMDDAPAMKALKPDE